jgi:Tol biopolymer transport system component
MRFSIRWLVLVGAAVGCAATQASSQASSQGPWRISVSSQGTQGTGLSDRPIISGDGRRVVFTSLADDLVHGDANSAADVFVHDLATGATELVSVSLSGVAGNGSCLWPVISADGSTASFSSLASDLVPGDTNSVADIFVRDLASGVTTRVSVTSTGRQTDSGGRGSALSSDGRVVAFMSAATNLVPGDTNGFQDIFVHDRDSGITERVSVSTTGEQGDGHCGGPWISGDGRYVSFGSEASNLVPDDTNQHRDVFVHDRVAHRTTRVSVSSSGVEGNSFSGFNHLTGYFTTFISPDARWVVFHSYASNLVPGDTNDVPDIFVFDRHSHTIVRASVASDGTESDGNSYFPVMYGEGRFVSFFSKGSTLVPGDTNLAGDVFVRDLWAGLTERISVNAAGQEGDLVSDYPTASLDGSLIVIESEATNLVRRDTNGVKDLYALRRSPVDEIAVSSCGSDLRVADASTDLSWTGSPRLACADPFVVQLRGVEPSTAGFLVYATSSGLPDTAAAPCVARPWRWLAAQSGPASLSVDLGAWALHDPTLTAGTFVRAQFWSRDLARAGARWSPVLTFVLRP